MGFSLDPSQDESQAQEQARIYQRKLYRPGQAASAEKPPTAQTGVKTSAPAAKPSLPAAKPAAPAARKGESPWPARGKKIGKIAAVLLGMLILGTISYAIFNDPVGAAKKARDAAFDRNLSPEERREKFQEFRLAMNDLTWKQKNQLNQDRREKFRQKIDRFIKLSEKEQDAELQKDILRMEKFRQEMKAKWAARNKNKANNGQAKNGGQGKQQGGGWGGGRGNNPAAAAIRERNRMDGSTPEERAGGDYYRDRMDQVRQRMGIAGGGWGGRGR